jgi:hypothetical protein
MFQVVWRPEDEALLVHLEDEAAVARLWRLQAPEDAPAPAGAAFALAAAARKLSAGEAAVVAAARGDARSLAARLLVDRYRDLPGPFVHASAVYFGRLATAWTLAGQQGEDHAALASVRSMAAWLALDDERTYLASLGRRLAHGAKPEEAETMARTAALGFFDELRESALAGARELTPRAARALASLGRVQAAANLAGLDATAARSCVARADSIRALVVDEALAPMSDEAAELKTREDGGAHARPMLERVAAAWAWSGCDEAVEHFAMDQITELAWPIYKQSSWDTLRAMLTPCIPLFESMEGRILRDPIRHLAYAADCAQMFVFLSETEKDKSREWLLAERALRLCPSHRNGRLVMAHLCARRAIGLLDQTSFFSAKTDIAEATRLVQRAEDTYPQSKAIPEARQRLADARARWGSP